MMSNLMQDRVISAKYPVLVIILCACFCFYKYVLQIYPSIITDQLMSEFQLTGLGLGNLAGTFYYSLMISQLFVGVILDTCNIRWVTSAAILACAVGAIFFSETHNLLVAELARSLMGIGVAFATVTYLKLVSIWFPERHYAFISGLLATAAMSGAVFGEAPLSWFIGNLGWRECLCNIGLAGIVLTILFNAVVRDSSSISRQEKSTKGSRVCFQDILQVIKNKQNWLLTLYGGLACSPMAVFGGLWGNPFLQQAYHIDKTLAASMVSLVFVGLGIGSPLFGLLSSHIGDKRRVMFFSTLLSCAAVNLVLYCHPLPIWLLGLLLFVFGFSLGAFMLVFSVGKEFNDVRLAATVIAMINASDAVLDGITEPGIGKILDWGWDGRMIGGAHYFSLHSYHAALAVLPIYLLVAAWLLCFLKTTKK